MGRTIKAPPPDLNALLVFATVVKAGSFTAAARALELPKSRVSRKVAELEEHLHARLLQRTTRKLSLTDAGRTYYEYCARIAAEVEDAERAVTSLQEIPRGLLRVTAPLSADWLGPILNAFLRRFPEVQVELVCTDRVVSLIDERFDVAVRAGQLSDSTLIARGLGRFRRFLAASPAYLRKRGRPKSPRDLARHDCLGFGSGSDRLRWQLQRAEGELIDVPFTSRLTMNDFNMLHQATVAGLGIAMLPVFGCIDDLRSKRLERVLRDYSTPETPLHAVYPSSRHLSPKVKAFLDHLQQHMSPPPWERGPAP